jgi:hypothetical protein
MAIEIRDFSSIICGFTIKVKQSHKIKFLTAGLMVIYGQYIN